jgi:hypothetical protein
MNDAAPLPTAGLRKLGPPWPQASAWLARLRVHDRGEGLAAIGALPDATRLAALLARDPEPKNDVVRLLRLRVALLRGENDRAVSLLEEALAEMKEGAALAYAPLPLAPAPGSTDDESLGDEGEPSLELPTGESDAATRRFCDWLAPSRGQRLSWPSPAERPLEAPTAGGRAGGMEPRAGVDAAGPAAAALGRWNAHSSVAAPRSRRSVVLALAATPGESPMARPVPPGQLKPARPLLALEDKAAVGLRSRLDAAASPGRGWGSISAQERPEVAAPWPRPPAAWAARLLDEEGR